VLVDFQSGIDRLSENIKHEYAGRMDEVPGIFSLMKPLEGTVEAVDLLSQYFDCHILTTAPWKNISAWSDKAAWVQQYFGDGKDSVFYKRLIISHRKDLLNGDYLIDDRTKNGAGAFKGMFIQFGSERFPNWKVVAEYLVHCAKGMQCLESVEYGRNTATRLNELTENEIAKLKGQLSVDLATVLMTDYPDKTFYIQRDYDYLFGNVSWEKPFLLYSDAEKHIEDDLRIRRSEGTPHYMIDKSYISVYLFSELQFLPESEGRSIIRELLTQIKNHTVRH
jgi:5'(3')-deoxyribonucleotidase